MENESKIQLALNKAKNISRTITNLRHPKAEADTKNLSKKNKFFCSEKYQFSPVIFDPPLLLKPPPPLIDKAYDYFQNSSLTPCQGQVATGRKPKCSAD